MSFNARTLLNVGRLTLLSAAAAISATGSAAAYETETDELLRFFERVCVAEAPDFIDVSAKLGSIGFDVIETVPGVYEASSFRSAYTVYVTPAIEIDGYASCALSVPRSSEDEAFDALEDFVLYRYGDNVSLEPDGYGGVAYRVVGVGTDLVFAAAGKNRGAAISVVVEPVTTAAE